MEVLHDAERVAGIHVGVGSCGGVPVVLSYEADRKTPPRKRLISVGNDSSVSNDSAFGAALPVGQSGGERIGASPENGYGGEDAAKVKGNVRVAAGQGDGAIRAGQVQPTSPVSVGSETKAVFGGQGPLSFPKFPSSYKKGDGIEK